MSLSVKDSGNNVTSIKSTIVAGEHVTHHNIDNSALPTGAASAANQALTLAALLAQATKLDNQPVAIAADGVGLATESTLNSANSNLSSILTAIGLLAKLTDTQPVDIVAGFPVGLALDASLLSILDRLIYPLNPFSAQYAEISTDIIDQTPTVLISGVPGVTLRVHSVTIGNEALQFGSGPAAVGTWVKLAKQSDNTTIRTFYAPVGSSKAYPVGLVAPFDITSDDGLSVICENTGAAVRASAIYTTV